MISMSRSMTDLTASGKGILAADESVATMSSRLAGAGVAPTGGNRRAYREMLLTAPGLARGISGVILCDETFRQRVTGGATFPDALASAGMLPGIKVDTGAKPLAGSPGEKVTEGLDGLRGRLTEYAALGARFAKWRAVFVIADGCPSWRALRANAHALARYAALCQEAGLVPIVEPEVLPGGRHPMDRCASATLAALLATVTELRELGVRLDAALIKPNMVLPGSDSAELATPGEVAGATMRTLNTVLPGETGGVAFLSGGQEPGRATANLAAIRSLPAAWPVTFSFGRALVDPALAAWRGEPGREWAGQRALLRQVAACSTALGGTDTPSPAAAAILTALPFRPVNGREPATRRPSVRGKLALLRTPRSTSAAQSWRDSHVRTARQIRDHGGQQP
jgi:fructose-bisphosphate aldolase, class I